MQVIVSSFCCALLCFAAAVASSPLPHELLQSKEKGSSPEVGKIKGRQGALWPACFLFLLSLSQKVPQHEQAKMSLGTSTKNKCQYFPWQLETKCFQVFKEIFLLHEDGLPVV